MVWLLWKNERAMILLITALDLLHEMSVSQHHQFPVGSSNETPCFLSSRFTNSAKKQM